MGIKQNLKNAIPESLTDGSVVNRSNGEKVLVTLLSIGAGFAAHGLINRAWKATTDKKLPKRPSRSEVDWKEALAWSIGSGAAVGVAKLLVQRGTESRLGRKVLSIRK